MTNPYRAPWRADPTWRGTITITDSEGRIVASVEKHGPGDHANGVEGARRNAELIALAPVMLHALAEAQSLANASSELLRNLQASGIAGSWRSAASVREAVERFERLAKS